MKRNMGSLDSIIRLVIAGTIAILIAVHVINGTAAIILGIADLVILFTVFFSFCPVYRLFGFNTCKVDKEENI